MTAERATLRPGAVAVRATTVRDAPADDVAGGATLPLMSEVATVPSFRVALRGYDTREVDRYTHLIEAELEAARVAHRELAHDVRSLSEQLDRAAEELALLRRRPTVDDTIAFRHLGPRVEQILAEAHAEADEIVAAASRTATELRNESEEKVRGILEEHDRIAAQFDEHRRWLHEEDERWTRLLRSRQEQVARAESYRRKIQESAEQILASATLQHERVVASALARAQQMIDEASARAQRIRDEARRAALAEESAALAGQLRPEERAAFAHRDQHPSEDAPTEAAPAPSPAAPSPAAPPPAAPSPAPSPAAPPPDAASS